MFPDICKLVLSKQSETLDKTRHYSENTCIAEEQPCINPNQTHNRRLLLVLYYWMLQYKNVQTFHNG